MKIGPFRIRLGHHDQDGKKLDWIDELARFSSTGTKYARCSFYVPNLTPVVIMLMVDSTSQSTADPAAAQKPLRININAGSDTFSDIIKLGQDVVRLYGAKISSTPFEGKDVSLQASEQIIEVAITSEDGLRELATFEFMHLECDKVPEHIELDQVHTNKDLQPWTYTAISNNAITAERLNQAEEDGKEKEEAGIEQEEDELMDSDEDISITSGVINGQPLPKIQPQQPTTPVRKLTVHTSLTPQFKTLVSQSTPKVKTEMPELQMSPDKPPTPAHKVKKDTLRKVAALERELKAAQSESKTLGVTLAKKEEKAKTAFDRAVRRAQEEHDAALRRNNEMKEELESQLDEQRETLRWVQQVINDNTEVIELSDSESDVVQLADEPSSESEDDVTSPFHSPSPTKRATVSC